MSGLFIVKHHFPLTETKEIASRLDLKSDLAICFQVWKGPVDRLSALLPSGYWVATACVLSGQEHSTCELCGRGRKKEDAVTLLPTTFFSLFITSSAQGGPEPKRNLAEFHGDAPGEG